MPAGSSRALRLDPFALPVRYAASDAAADERVRDIELHRERVVVRRAVRGMRMAVNLPLSSFLGVTMRILPPDGADAPVVAVVLEHADPGLALPLFMAPESDDALALWHCWSRVLGLPLLVADEGGLREPFPRIGKVRVEAPRPRRRRRSVLKRRRPSIFLRRRPGRPSANPTIHRDEREIIARN
ncbi:MAG TPA: DUF6101 family protein [Pseudolabrys sp.]|nr:DUF6101 family protein [Pseudolabrys sp.]